MSLKISYCKGCGVRFEPWKPFCPECGQPVRVVGVLAFAGTILSVHLLLWILHLTVGWPAHYDIW